MNSLSNINICVIGLGYVGLPLAVTLSKKFVTMGFDIDTNRVSEISNGLDRMDKPSKKLLKTFWIEPNNLSGKITLSFEKITSVLSLLKYTKIIIKNIRDIEKSKPKPAL